jgi:hypothetical protein
MAFVVSNPICKLQEIYRGIILVRNFFSSNFPCNMELDEDDYLAILTSYFYLVNPPYIVSNLIFLCEFCFAQKFASLFHDLAVAPMSILTLIAEKIPGLHRDALMRRKCP